MSKTQVIYKDVAPGADEDAAVSTVGAAAFSAVGDLPFGQGTPAPVATLEPDLWKLDGAFVLREEQPVSFWSSELSGADGTFQSAPSITAAFSRQFSSLGVTLVFDTTTGDYCRAVNIKWYQGETLQADQDFAPDAATFFCKQRVTPFDKIVVTLQATSKPYRYAKLEQIVFGIYRYFDMTEMRSASIVNDMDLLSAELPISTFRVTIDSRDELEYMFQLKQPLEVLNNGNLIGVYYIDQYARQAESLYDLDCYNAFGVLDEIPFAGGVYSGKSAKALLEEIIAGDFALSFTAADAALTGAILPGTRREAVQQVLFALGASAAADGLHGIRVFNAPSTGGGEIAASRTYQGAGAEVSSVVTEVRVTAHAYTQDSDGSVEIGGVKYKDTETVYTVTNPDVTANDKRNVVEITGGTLVSTGIGQAAAQRVYDDYARRQTNRAKIVWDGEALGDRVTLPNAWGGTETGNVVKMEIKLSNTVAASLEVR